MSIADQDKTKILSRNLFPVVGIGASAGGMEAFRRLVRAIPVDSGMAYILVQHLHPDHSSSLPEILQRETTIPVHEISDNVEVRPNQVYVIPENKILVATDGVLQLSPRPPKEQKNMSIDIFFSSLAEVHQSHAIGIVLSGTGSDGTLGLKSIKDQGGVTLVQDPLNAAYDAMPLSAIKAEVVDFILAPEDMPQQLLKLNNTLNRISSNDRVSPGHSVEEECFRQIIALLRVRTGVDFTYYKQTTIRRRILRRLAILKLDKIVEYHDHLKNDKAEQDILFQDLLIPVTAFFRDPATFDNLCETTFPELLKSKSPGSPLRIWVAGCSTGQEAYSMGMCLQEYLNDKIFAVKIQIFATDISERSITDLEGVSDSRLQQFFIRTDGSYQVKKTIRDMCVFACHNFLKDPPFAKIDLISCRNALIYMEPFLQKKAFTTFHYALREKGYLLLGRSETIGSSSELFVPFGKKEKMYERKPLPGRFRSVTSEGREEKLKDRNHVSRSSEKRKEDFQKNADDILLSKYTPAGVIVNDHFDIVQFRGATGDFLEPSPGKASLHVLKMAREGLSFELRNALHKAKTTKEDFSKEGIPINNGKRLISIEVIPLLNAIEPHFLILFRDTVADLPSGLDEMAIAAVGIDDGKNNRIRQLEKDLLHAREDMRGISEDQEAVNEELQSANEELLSGSEELQSLNEELETSKEELQSTNEELITVNQELFDRNDQLNLARLYAEAIATTIHEPLLVLSQNFRIISGNKSFYKNFSIPEEESTGKILFELQDNKWDIPGLRDQLLKIQTENEKFIEWEITYTFPAIGRRTICLNAQPIQKENGENWIMLAFNDITLWKDKEDVEKKNAQDLKIILETLPQITSTAAPDGSITFFNQSFLDYAEMGFDEAVSNGWQTVINPEMLPDVLKAWEHCIKTGEDFNMELMLKRKSDDAYRWHLLRASAIRNADGIITSWVGTATDLNDQKTKEQAKDEFISIASHELKTPLTTAKAYIQLLQMSIEKGNTKELIYAQKATTAINRLNDLIAELLDVSKIQNGKLALNITAFNFNEMMASAIEDVQHASPNHNIQMIGEIRPAIKGDQQRLQQVVINLLTNAVKYSPKSDTVRVNITEENGWVMVSVQDTGIGILKANLEKVFERYYREDGRSIYFEGLGIGLSISHEIIQRHHGRLWVESEAEKGSTFYFTIPVQ